MKKLFALLFIAGVIASCGSPSATESTTNTDSLSTAVDSCLVADSVVTITETSSTEVK